MAKSTKLIVGNRITDVVRLLLAGAEFAEIRQYASAHSWRVSDRQIRRYLEKAYKRLARASRRDRDQLLGRHLMQRRVLYARSLKANDNRTALQILRDEAELEGLYPPTKITRTEIDSEPCKSDESPEGLSRRERLAKLLVADACNDANQLRLLSQVTPIRPYHLADTALPYHMVIFITLTYVTQQLEALATVCNSISSRAHAKDTPNDCWEAIIQQKAHSFRVGQEAWDMFTKRLGVDGQYLVRSVYSGNTLDLYCDRICGIAPTNAEMEAIVTKEGGDPRKLVTAESLAKNWWRMFSKVCPA